MGVGCKWILASAFLVGTACASEPAKVSPEERDLQRVLQAVLDYPQIAREVGGRELVIPFVRPRTRFFLNKKPVKSKPSLTYKERDSHHFVEIVCVLLTPFSLVDEQRRFFIEGTIRPECRDFECEAYLSPKGVRIESCRVSIE